VRFAWDVVLFVSDLQKHQGQACPLCADTGVMRWMQPNMECTELREMTHPCVNGCGESWRHPAAEKDLVIDERADLVGGTEFGESADREAG
jgi:hypothetical protein